MWKYCFWTRENRGGLCIEMAFLELRREHWTLSGLIRISKAEGGIPLPHSAFLAETTQLQASSLHWSENKDTHLNCHQVSETIKEEMDLSNILKTSDTFSPSAAIKINSIAQKNIRVASEILFTLHSFNFKSLLFYLILISINVKKHLQRTK